MSERLLVYLYGLLIIIFGVLLTSCVSSDNYAPVTEINTIEPIPKAGVHRVTQGETLYEIAWRYGLDYRYLAARNQIKPPYAIHPGQEIYLRGGNFPRAVVTDSEIAALLDTSLAPKSDFSTTKAKEQSQQKEAIRSKVKLSDPSLTKRILQPSLAKLNIKQEPKAVVSKWLWPVKGKVIHSFSALNKGINIGGYTGEAIFAAAAGKVVYSGNGLRGYGNLIILKHNSLYLSAYAHSRILLVKEGDWVKQGQKIAEMGNIGTSRVMLHFEIRRAGKPVDPISLLSH